MPCCSCCHGDTSFVHVAVHHIPIQVHGLQSTRTPAGFSFCINISNIYVYIYLYIYSIFTDIYLSLNLTRNSGVLFLMLCQCITRCIAMCKKKKKKKKKTEDEQTAESLMTLGPGLRQRPAVYPVNSSTNMTGVTAIDWGGRSLSRQGWPWCYKVESEHKWLNEHQNFLAYLHLSPGIF